MGNDDDDDDDDDDDEWWGIVFLVSLTDEMQLALFPAKTIVRDLNHHESPARLEQSLFLRITWVHI